jgi:hypothetical protein
MAEYREKVYILITAEAHPDGIDVSDVAQKIFQELQTMSMVYDDETVALRFIGVDVISGDDFGGFSNWKDLKKYAKSKEED